MLKRIAKILFIKLPVGFLLLGLAWVLLYKVVPIKWTPLMLKRSIENIDQKGYKNQQIWVDIENVSPLMVRAIIASEDGRFMEHHGIDFQELKKMKKEHKNKGNKIRGCSTISQQVPKNCFTFCGQTWWRKCFETYYTLLIELLWSKERIMEVYLNVAETGKGVFGVEKIAIQCYNIPTSKLNMHQAVSISCVLPNPLARNPKTLSQKNKSKYNVTYKRAEQTPYPFN